MTTTRPEPSQAAAQIPASDEAGPLPVFSERELIVSTVRSSQFVIISGATGSGIHFLFDPLDIELTMVDLSVINLVFTCRNCLRFYGFQGCVI
jgi:hypothetical protein